MNLCNFDMEQFFNSNNYIIEDVKTIGVFNPKRWTETFGKSLTRNIIEAKIIHTLEGLTIPLKRYAGAKEMQVVEFAGINGYTEKSRLLKSLLIELIPQFQNCILKRVDVCKDYLRVPNSIIKRICTNGREPFKPNSHKWNTTYYKTAKEKKSNTTIDIKKYDKQIKDKLAKPMERLEFAFKGAYLKNMELKELEAKLLHKMEKSIFKFSGISNKIIPIS